MSATLDDNQLAEAAVGAPRPPHRTGPSARSQLFLILFATLASVGASVAYVLVRPTEYSATANVFVAPLASDDPISRGLPFIRESSDGSRPVQSAVGLLATPDVARRTAERLGGGWTRDAVEDAVVVTPRGQSDLIAISARADEAEGAAQIANTYAVAALELRRETVTPYVEMEIARLEQSVIGRGDPEAAEATLRRLNGVLENGDPTLSVASIALPPTAPAEKSALVVILVAGLAGLLVGIGAAFLRNVVAPPDLY